MDHAQQHSGQHLLSAMFLRELGLPTVSFHLGAESVTIDLDAEKISPEDLFRVEDAVNRLIFEDRRMLSHWVEREEAERMLARGELRKLPERAGQMRIVEIEGLEFNACGGTHVRSTGAIGGLLVRRLEKVRQGQRVEFCCGLRAVKTARSDYIRLRELGALLSVGPAELAGRVAGLIEDKKQRAKERKLLERQLREMEDRLTASSEESRPRDEDRGQS
jgi:alanyl-tRNA synthetase